MNNKYVFLDEFRQDIKNPNKHTNHPQKSFGFVSIEFSSESGDFVRLNTGIYLYRNSCFMKTSPYGWLDFHKYICSNPSNYSNNNLARKVKEFDIECRYLLGIHKNNLRPLFPTNDFSRELNRQENSNFTKYVEDFYSKYKQLFNRFKYDNVFEELESSLENFGLVV